ncbi:MAG: OmpW family outer membrane protein [Pseudomonadota bacterium]
MKSKITCKLIAAAALSMTVAVPVFAQEAGDWQFRVGLGYVAPDTSDDDLFVSTADLGTVAGAQIDVDDAPGLVFNATYFFSSNWGLEILAAAPFEHDVDGAGILEGVGELGSVKHLPPVVSLQYHFRPNQTVRPYVGAGLNYTLFFDEDTTDGLHEAIVGTANNALGANFSGGSTNLSVDDSFGLALQAGFDIDLSENWFLNFDLRWIDIAVDAELETTTFADGNMDNATTINSAIDVDIDPWVFSSTIGFRF